MIMVLEGYAPHILAGAITVSSLAVMKIKKGGLLFTYVTPTGRTNIFLENKGIEEALIEAEKRKDIAVVEKVHDGCFLYRNQGLKDEVREALGNDELTILERNC